MSRTVTTDDWKLDKLLAAVGSEIEAREKAAQEEAETLQKPTKNPPTTAALLSTPAPACRYCGESHQSSSCRTVPDIDQRRQCLLKMGRCFVCLRRGHKGIDCRSSLKCSICQGRHHLSICPRPRQANNSQPVLLHLYRQVKIHHELFKLLQLTDDRQRCSCMSAPRLQYCCKLHV